ncbi:MAG TPA: anhydro-N-acetylmuramic acid kinase [Acidisarcina sp.]|nr:anhydro-N-acetylmuramic acid kinase [Acidisarcina sp.]
MRRTQAESADKPMIVAGVMSGTSADGVDVALVRIRPKGAGPDLELDLKLIAHVSFPFSTALRRSVLDAMDARSTTTAELARLNWRLGITYAEAVRSTLAEHPVKLQLIGCHGQTVYHQAKPERYAGRTFACTWQIGEMALLAREMRVPVVSNFRPADMAAGGQGAPLVPLLDYVLFRDAKRGRVLQNLGGIGNLTAVPRSAGISQVLAFDTGPANMVIDAVTQLLFQQSFDRGGHIAARGRVLEEVLTPLLRQPFFSAAPPKTAGREEFGSEYARKFAALCSRASTQPEDAVATATALTARSIGLAYERFVQPLMQGAAVDYVLSGGGSQNATLVEMLRATLEPLHCRIMTSDDLGLPSQAKEATAFALLAWQTWHHRPGNVPSATGATEAALLGQITYA